MGLLFHGTFYPKEEGLLFLLDQYEKNKAVFCDEFLKQLYIAASLFLRSADTDSERNAPARLIERLMNDNERQEAMASLTMAFKAGDAYNHNYEVAAQQLLRCNVQRLIPFTLNFDFTMYEDPEDKNRRSLEHIFPKSKFRESAGCEIAGGNEDNTTINERLGNNIGNLVLLPKGLNSSLKDKDFSEKQKIVNTALLSAGPGKANMALWLHSLKIFISYREWGTSAIEKNQKEFLAELNEVYR